MTICVVCVARRALEREVGRQDVVRVPVALVLDRRTRRRRQCLGRPAARVATAACRDEREGGDEQADEEYPIPLEVQALPPSWETVRPAPGRAFPLRGVECRQARGRRESECAGLGAATGDRRYLSTIPVQAEVAELVDAADSKSVARKGVWVRAPPSASKRTVTRCGRSFDTTCRSDRGQLV